jgi:hypothetical protein
VGFTGGKNVFSFAVEEGKFSILLLASSRQNKSDNETQGTSYGEYFCLIVAFYHLGTHII